MPYEVEMALRLLAAVLAGILIGAERARHGRSAGMRTHVLVCLGAALTSVTSMYIYDMVGHNGDVFRISAQVISGIGFLGAGMIILRNDNTIQGLTTAAGIWATGAIGVALGYGVYIGAATATLLLLATVIFLSRFEKTKKIVRCIVYAEMDDMNYLNAAISALEKQFPPRLSYKVKPSVAKAPNHIGLEIYLTNPNANYIERIVEIPHIVFAVEDLDL